MQADAKLLVDHAYTQLTTRFLREGALIDPAGPASAILRHFDVAIAENGQTGYQDGRVEGRTLWISPTVIAGWLSRHKANRERRVNGWMRLTEAAQALMIQLGVSAMRGVALTEVDRIGLVQSLGSTPRGSRLKHEMEHLYSIEIDENDTFYLMREPEAAIAAMRAVGTPFADNWKLLLSSGQDMIEPPLETAERRLPPGIPTQDRTVADRARLIVFSRQTPEPPVLDESAERMATIKAVASGFVKAIEPLLGYPKLPPPFLFEDLAHGYIEALANTPQKRLLLPFMDQQGRPQAALRLHCVMDAIQRISVKTDDVGPYEAALLAGLCNLDRQD